MKIGLVRHGVTHWNKEGRAQGHSDVPLDEEGKKQAQLLSSFLEKTDWDVLYASPLERAKDTAEILNTKLNKNIYLDSRLREISGGLTEGTTEQERINKWGIYSRELDMQMESHEFVEDRAISFMNELEKHHSDQNVLIVSHGSFLKRLIKILIPETDVKTSLANTSLTCLEKRDDEWFVTLYNSIDHLTDLEDYDSITKQ